MPPRRLSEFVVWCFIPSYTMKKILVSILIILLSGISIGMVNLEEKNNDKISAGEEILDYAFAAIRYLPSYNDLPALEKIARTYKKIGRIKKSLQVEKLAKERARKVFGESSISIPLHPYEKEWRDIEKLILKQDFSKAIEASQNNPYALAKIGNIYAAKGEIGRAKELLALAYEKESDSGFRERLLLEIGCGYVKTGDYGRAFDIADKSRYRDSIFYEISKSFLENREIDKVFEVIGRMRSVFLKINILSDLAIACDNSNVRLDDAKRKILEESITLIRENSRISKKQLFSAILSAILRGLSGIIGFISLVAAGVVFYYKYSKKNCGFRLSSIEAVSSGVFTFLLSLCVMLYLHLALRGISEAYY